MSLSYLIASTDQSFFNFQFKLAVIITCIKLVSFKFEEHHTFCLSNTYWSFLMAEQSALSFSLSLSKSHSFYHCPQHSPGFVRSFIILTTLSVQKCCSTFSLVLFPLSLSYGTISVTFFCNYFSSNFFLLLIYSFIWLYSIYSANAEFYPSLHNYILFLVLFFLISSRLIVNLPFSFIYSILIIFCKHAIPRKM